MHPFTHALIGWTVANVVPLSRRDRAIVMVASVIPDINGLRVLIDLATSHSTNPTQQLTWRGQWALNAWPNFLLTGMLLAAMFYLAWQHGYSPVEIFSPKADAAFITTLRARFGIPGTSPTRQSKGIPA